MIGHPYNEAVSMATLEAELLARWGPTRQLRRLWPFHRLSGHGGCGHDLR